MKTLKLSVNGQKLELLNPEILNTMVPGTEKGITISCTFDRTWDPYIKFGRFFSILGKEYDPSILQSGLFCYVPSEALKKRSFKVQIYGRDTINKEILVTNKITIRQGGKT